MKERACLHEVQGLRFRGSEIFRLMWRRYNQAEFPHIQTAKVRQVISVKWIMRLMSETSSCRGDRQTRQHIKGHICCCLAHETLQLFNVSCVYSRTVAKSILSLGYRLILAHDPAVAMPRRVTSIETYSFSHSYGCLPKL